MHSIRIIGPGRAGTSLAAALSARGLGRSPASLGRHDDVSGAARGVDVLVIATPDDAVAEVAAAVVPVEGTTVVHLSGSLGLDALAPHPRAGRGAPARAAAQRRGRCGPPVLGGDLRRRRRPGRPRDIVECLGGRMVEVADGDRAAYHAAACIAANHVVALLGQVERVAASVGPGPRVLPAADPRRRRRRGRARRARRADRPGPPGRLGHAQPPPRRAARGRAPGLPGRRRPGDPPGPRRYPVSRRRPCRRRCRRDRTMEVVETAPPAATLLDAGARRRARSSAWCRPWGRCTTGTPRSWPGPAPSATWSRSASS